MTGAMKPSHYAERRKAENAKLREKFKRKMEEARKDIRTEIRWCMPPEAGSKGYGHSSRGGAR